MGVRLEWVSAHAVRAALIDRTALERMAVDEPVGDVGLVVHSGSGDGAVIEGDATEIADYLSDAAVQLSRHTGARLHPQVYADHVAEMVNTAADDVLLRLRQAGVGVDASMECLINLVVNVVVNRVKSGQGQPVDEVIHANWPETDVTEVLWWCAQ